MPPRRPTRPNRKTQLLEIAGLSVTVQHKAIKNLHLRVRAPDGLVSVSAPRWLSSSAIRAMVESRLEWIERQRALIRQRASQRQVFVPQLTDGQRFELLGQSLPVREIQDGSRPAPHVMPHGTAKLRLGIHDGELWYLRRGALTSDQSRTVLRGFYRQQLETVIAERLDHWCGVAGVRPDFVGIKRMKTRWGSCNTRDARIWLNLELARLPIGCIDHVLVHELTHLHERLHNARFHALMDRFMPDWRHWSAELDRLGMAGL